MGWHPEPSCERKELTSEILVFQPRQLMICNGFSYRWIPKWEKQAFIGAATLRQDMKQNLKAQPSKEVSLWVNRALARASPLLQRKKIFWVTQSKIFTFETFLWSLSDEKMLSERIISSCPAGSEMLTKTNPTGRCRARTTEAICIESRAPVYARSWMILKEFY